MFEPEYISRINEHFQVSKQQAYEEFLTAKLNDANYQELFEIARNTARFYWSYNTAGNARELLRRHKNIRLIKSDDLYWVIRRHLPEPLWRETEEELIRSPEIRYGTQECRRLYLLKPRVQTVRKLKESIACESCGLDWKQWWRDRRNKIIEGTPLGLECWTDWVCVSRHYKGKHWSCSHKCRRRIERRIISEGQWLKTARQRQKRVRRWLRDRQNRAA